MKEEIINKVAEILATTNPLGDQSKNIPDLEGYYYEAVDILSTLNFMSGPKKIEKAIVQVLTQAFEITPEPAQVSKAANEIEKLLSKGNVTN